MRILTSAKYALGVTAAVAVLAACSGGSGSQIAPSSPGMTGNAIGSGVHMNSKRLPLIAAHANVHIQKYHGKNWMEPGANKNRLLYVSDYNNSIVQVFNYPSQGTQNPPAGTLTGFENPQGECVDKSNNVYITNTTAENVLVYAWGASSPSMTLNNSGEYPVGCSVDPTTGNVAVSDIFSPTTGLGAVTVFPSGSTNGTTYTEPGGLLECFFIGYMPNGDLYVDGFSSFGFGMAYLPAGSSSWSAVSFSGATINFPGGVQTDGTNLDVGDQSGSGGYSVIHQCSASGNTVTCGSGATGLQSSTDVVQYFIKRGIKGVIGPDASTGNANTWAYPAGGSPRPNKVIHVPQSYPLNIGAAVLLGH
jgi:hypothetical protein